jgi:hypothetical protein
MANYFRYLPEFEYVSRLPDAKISDYIKVKNLFKKGKIREDIFQNLSFFEKYKIVGNDRPDNVAYEVYGDATLDWVILLCNNIVSIQTEWPMEQNNLDAYLLSKYNNDYNNLYNGIHHYETIEVRNSQNFIVLPAGLQVQSDYSISYYDYLTDAQIDRRDVTIPITNYEYEESLENNKRNIFILKKQYLGIILNDMNEIMAYKEGSSQYKTETLKRADNIRLYE